jgi:predicted MFS family arabinose efflux permease
MSLACMAVVPVLLLTNIPAAALLVVFGVVVGISSGPVFALAGQGLQPDERALAMGIVMTIFNVTMAVAPPLAGFARDVTGSPAAPFYVAAAFLLAMLLIQILHSVWRRAAPLTAAI